MAVVALEPRGSVYERSTIAAMIAGSPDTLAWSPGRNQFQHRRVLRSTTRCR